MRAKTLSVSEVDPPYVPNGVMNQSPEAKTSSASSDNQSRSCIKSPPQLFTNFAKRFGIKTSMILAVLQLENNDVTFGHNDNTVLGYSFLSDV